MRIFAGDSVPHLALVAQALPRPWVLPDGIGRRHRNRLVRILYMALRGTQPGLRLGELDYTALRGTQPGLRLGELGWGERDLVARGRMALPPEILIRWRVDPLPGLERREVMRECERLGPALAVFDFGPSRGEEALAWLGPLKLEVLRRLIDALSDHEPVKEVPRVVDVLQELAERLRSPVDLVDVAEIMIEQIALGQAVSGARAEACARSLVARFEDDVDEHDGTDILQGLAALATGEPLDEELRDLFADAGLIETSSGHPLPLVELVREDEVHRRARRLVLTRFSLREPVPGLDADLDIPMTVVPADLSRARRPHSGEDVSLPPIPLSPSRGALPVEAAATGTSPRAELLRRASDLLASGRDEAAAKLVVDALRRQDRSSWEPGEAELAGRILGQIATANLANDPKRVSLWLELTADVLEQSGAGREAAEMLLMAAQAAQGAKDGMRAMTIIERLHPREARLPPAKRMLMYRILGDAQHGLGLHADAEAAYQRALALAESLDDKAEQMRLHLALAETPHAQANIEATQASYQRAHALSRELGDLTAEAGSLLGLGMTALLRHEVDHAEKHLRAALKLLPAEDLSGKGYVGMSLAEAFSRRGSWKSAHQYLQRALRWFRQAGEWDGEADALLALGHMHLQLRKVGHARAVFESLLAESRRHGDATREAHALAGLGEVLCRLGDLDAARRHGEQARARARQADALEAEMDAWHVLGLIHVWAGDLEASQRIHEQALAQARETHEDADLLDLELSLAAVLIARGGEPRELLADARRLAEAGYDPYPRIHVEILDAALQSAAEPAAARATWVRAADALRGLGQHTDAALVQAIIEVIDGRALDQVAETLTTRLGAVHPLPDRVRDAASPVAAIRAILPLL